MRPSTLFEDEAPFVADLHRFVHHFFKNSVTGETAQPSFL
jgi:hypothetical protein